MNLLDIKWILSHHICWYLLPRKSHRPGKPSSNEGRTSVLKGVSINNINNRLDHSRRWLDYTTDQWFKPSYINFYMTVEKHKHLQHMTGWCIYMYDCRETQAPATHDRLMYIWHEHNTMTCNAWQTICVMRHQHLQYRTACYISRDTSTCNDWQPVKYK